MIKIALLTLLIVTTALAEQCFKIDKNGKTVPVKRPPKLTSGEVFCVDSGLGVAMESAATIEIKGAEKEQTISTSLGEVFLRMDRDAQKMVTVKLDKVIKQAYQAVYDKLSKFSFLRDLILDKREWNIALFGEQLPTRAIPAELMTNCHPGWMVPPADIFLVVARMLGNCGGKGQAVATAASNEMFLRVLIHEMGHVIENRLIGLTHDAAAHEGFATWFQGFIQGEGVEEFARELPNYTKDQIFARSFDHSTRDYYRYALRYKTIEANDGAEAIFKGYMAAKQNGGDPIAHYLTKTKQTETGFNEEIWRFYQKKVRS